MRDAEQLRLRLAPPLRGRPAPSKARSQGLRGSRARGPPPTLGRAPAPCARPVDPPQFRVPDSVPRTRADVVCGAQARWPLRLPKPKNFFKEPRIRDPARSTLQQRHSQPPTSQTYSPLRPSEPRKAVRRAPAPRGPRGSRKPLPGGARRQVGLQPGAGAAGLAGSPGWPGLPQDHSWKIAGAQPALPGERGQYTRSLRSLRPTDLSNPVSLAKPLGARLHRGGPPPPGSRSQAAPADRWGCSPREAPLGSPVLLAGPGSPGTTGGKSQARSPPCLRRGASLATHLPCSSSAGRSGAGTGTPRPPG
ncbi:uncharacterized protein [Macaca fascicularis]|uniref:uncharacterized protein n=1 Tax=Macaca fascicularis TaxID=9541 RepID=UPI003D156E8C